MRSAQNFTVAFTSFGKYFMGDILCIKGVKYRKTYPNVSHKTAEEDFTLDVDKVLEHEIVSLYFHIYKTQRTKYIHAHKSCC